MLNIDIAKLAYSLKCAREGTATFQEFFFKLSVPKGIF